MGRQCTAGNLQRKSVHGLKHQIVDLAYGFTIDMFVPTSLRRSDLTVLAESEINYKLAHIQEGNQQQLRAFGDSDSIYHQDVYSYHKGENLTECIIRNNGKKKRVRVALKWNDGTTADLFKVLNGATVVKVYTVATILRICRVALYILLSASYILHF